MLRGCVGIGLLVTVARAIDARTLYAVATVQEVQRRHVRHCVHAASDGGVHWQPPSAQRVVSYRPATGGGRTRGAAAPARSSASAHGHVRYSACAAPNL